MIVTIVVLTTKDLICYKFIKSLIVNQKNA